VKEEVLVDRHAQGGCHDQAPQVLAQHPAQGASSVDQRQQAEARPAKPRQGKQSNRQLADRELGCGSSPGADEHHHAEQKPGTQVNLPPHDRSRV